jgi:single-strand DNA-binding protein
MNKVTLIGRVGKDPETRYLPNGTAITDLSLATSRRWTDKQTNERKEETQWHNLVFFGKLAETAGKYVKKGDQLAAEGEIEYQQWEKDGGKKYRTVIRCQGLELLGNKQNQSTDSNKAAAKPEPQAQNHDDFEDDIPF